jgi:hypothetical protein
MEKCHPLCSEICQAPTNGTSALDTLFIRNVLGIIGTVVQPIGTGLEARAREKRAFFDLAERLANSSNAAEQKRLKEELARMTFGE